ncbi:hypothetical protein EII17_06820 [Clostridiales bacterium COT073_COT-073]|nr:hypothetical protein EII17_06820 [Clostridiales bacterium COT073_COT-073]
MMTKKTNLFLFSIGLLMAMLFCLSAAPTKAAKPMTYLLDNIGLFNDQEAEYINHKLSLHYEENMPHYLTFMVTLDENAMLPRQDLLQYTNVLINRETFGHIEAPEYGAIFLFINRSPKGKIEMAVLPTNNQTENYSQYNIDHMEKSLLETYTSTQNWYSVTLDLIRLVNTYRGYFINELVTEKINPEDIDAAKNELGWWVDKYNYNLVFLLTDGLSPALRDQYLQDYFHKGGYGSWNDGVGAFVLYDHTEKKAYLEVYGDIILGGDGQRLTQLLNDLSKSLSQYRILDAVYMVERYLDPIGELPLTFTLDGNSTPIITTLHDPDNLLNDAQSVELVTLTEVFSAKTNHYLGTYIYQSAKDALSQSPESFLQDLFAQIPGNSGMILLFDQAGKDYHLYAAAELNDYLKKNKKIIDPVLQHLKNRLKKNGYSSQSIFQHQQDLITFLDFLMVYQQENSYLVSGQPMSLKEKPETLKSLKKSGNAGLKPMVVNLSQSERIQSTAQWIDQFEQILEAADLTDEVVVLFYDVPKNQASVRYFGDNKDLASLTRKEIEPAVVKAFQAGSPQANTPFHTFISTVETKALPLLSEQAEAKENDSSQTDKTGENQKADGKEKDTKDQDKKDKKEKDSKGKDKKEKGSKDQDNDKSQPDKSSPDPSENKKTAEAQSDGKSESEATADTKANGQKAVAKTDKAAQTSSSKGVIIALLGGIGLLLVIILILILVLISKKKQANLYSAEQSAQTLYPEDSDDWSDPNNNYYSPAEYPDQDPNDPNNQNYYQ